MPVIGPALWNLFLALVPLALAPRLAKSLLRRRRLPTSERVGLVGLFLVWLVFLPNSEPLAAATQAAVRGALSQWLGDVIAVEDVSATAVDARLEVVVRYVVRRTQERQTLVIDRAVA